jgi:hypothetical protein
VKRLLVLTVAILTVMFFGTAAISAAFARPDSGPAPHVGPEHWPAYTPDPAWQEAARSAINSPSAAPVIYQRALQDYTATGDYGNMSRWLHWTAQEKLAFDYQGTPLVRYNMAFYYNPVTVAQACLVDYGKYHNSKSDADREALRLVVERLYTLEYQSGSAVGAFPYYFPFPVFYNGTTMAPGWRSGMAQGMALSCYSRAYAVFGDQRYIDAGNRSLMMLVKPVAEGGTLGNLGGLDPSLADYVIFEEYTDTSACRCTLNGFMFAMLGVYDWTQTPAADTQTAAVYWGRALDTLSHILPYFDVGGFTAYDLVYLTHPGKLSMPHVEPAYHPIHIYLLHAINSVAPKAEFSDALAAWQGDYQYRTAITAPADDPPAP